jgi:hypothetical protein
MIAILQLHTFLFCVTFNRCFSGLHNSALFLLCIALETLLWFPKLFIISSGRKAFLFIFGQEA